MKRFNNFYQFLAIVMTIAIAGFSAGMWINYNILDKIVTEEKVYEIAQEVAKTTVQEMLYEEAKRIALDDADDFVKGYIESGKTVDDYIQYTYDFKTRVYKGGMLLVDNQYNVKTTLIDKYGQSIIESLVAGLLNM